MFDALFRADLFEIIEERWTIPCTNFLCSMKLDPLRGFCAFGPAFIAMALVLTLAITLAWCEKRQKKALPAAAAAAAAKPKAQKKKPPKAQD